MKTYKKPETKIVLYSIEESIMQILETSTGTGNVGGYDNPSDPDLVSAHPFEDDEDMQIDIQWHSLLDGRGDTLERKVHRYFDNYGRSGR